MPELPEVETIRARLAPLVEGRRLERVEILDPRLTRPEPPELVAARLVGARIEALRRRGKYLIFALDGDLRLLVHLRMTGGLFHYAQRGKPDPYWRAELTLDDGSRLVYRDVRRFGTWALLEPDELERQLAARLGPEPLEPGFTPQELAGRLTGRKGPLKAALLDQRTVAGLGNIYVDEALWWAGLGPRRVAGSLDEEEVVRLLEAIQRSLRLGLERQGSTLRDYRDPSGSRGRMQDEFRVYGRAGLPCGRCGRPIEKLRIAGRGSWFCPACQG